MATKSIFENVNITTTKEAKIVCSVLAAESPCKNILPVSDEDIRRSSEKAKEWQSRHIR